MFVWMCVRVSVLCIMYILRSHLRTTWCFSSRDLIYGRRSSWSWPLRMTWPRQMPVITSGGKTPISIRKPNLWKANRTPLRQGTPTNGKTDDRTWTKVLFLFLSLPVGIQNKVTWHGHRLVRCCFVGMSNLLCCYFIKLWLNKKRKQKQKLKIKENKRRKKTTTTKVPLFIGSNAADKTGSFPPLDLPLHPRSFLPLLLFSPHNATSRRTQISLYLPVGEFPISLAGLPPRAPGKSFRLNVLRLQHGKNQSSRATRMSVLPFPFPFARSIIFLGSLPQFYLRFRCPGVRLRFSPEAWYILWWNHIPACTFPHPQHRLRTSESVLK